MKLLIVESPGKVKKIQEILGQDYQVMACGGHVRDLPEEGLGLDLNNFQPHYLPTPQGRMFLSPLKEAARKASAVYLATDPDREGEAIAWHLTEALDLKDPWRVTFTEITEKAVRAALAAPRRTDLNLVRSQEGRRVLDRLVGWLVTGPVSDAGGANLSTGRVQAPALRLVVEREAVIQNFRFVTHFGVELTIKSPTNILPGWRAQWNPKPWLDEGQEYFLDQKTAERIAAIKYLTVTGYEVAEARQAPPAPFTTSTLQQAASNALKFSPKRTMELAQELYQAGHITYMRTDFPNLSEDAIAEIRSLASQNDWPVPVKPRTWKSKAGAQEAHEAIRPTHFGVEEAGANEDEKSLYRLIRLRALACQLEDATYTVTKAGLEAELDGKQVLFEARNRRLRSPGWRLLLEKFLAEAQEEDEAEELANPIPVLREGDQVTADSGQVQTKKTAPPARYTEAGLIREMEKKGFGRPSTYAPTLDRIQKKGYVALEKRQLVPTALGVKLIQVMTGHFSFLDYKFTSDLEGRLDEIATGHSQYLEVVKDLYQNLDGEIRDFSQTSAKNCPDCGRRLRHRFKKATSKDRGYDFWGCSGYEEGACQAAFANECGQPGARLEKKAPLALSEHKCPECGQPLIHMLKPGAKGYNYWKCSGGPDCTARYLDDGGRPGVKKEAAIMSEFNCPKCHKPLVRRRGAGKDGQPSEFFGCSGYPKCKASFKIKDDRPDFNGSN
jgi:DNA topoisomerase-1